MSTIGERIAEFRKARGLSQAAFGAIGSVSKITQLKYESGERKPDTDYLLAIHGAGADLLYILTGQRAGEALSAMETSALDAFRALTNEQQQAVQVIMSSMVGRPLQRHQAQRD